jgi:signal peptidase I
MKQLSDDGWTPGRETIVPALQGMATKQGVPVTVTGNCMAPTLGEGEQITVRWRQRYWPGDVIVFDKRGSGLTVHRVLGGYYKQGEWRYVTKADNSAVADAAFPGASIIGRVCAMPVSPLQRLTCVLAFVHHSFRQVLRKLAQ